MTLNDIVAYAISILLGLSGILVVAEALGFLPPWASRWLTRNRLPQTLAVLHEMGLDIDRQKRFNIATSLTEHFDIRELPSRVRSALGPLTIEKAVGIGGTDIVKAERYIDLMGGTTDPRTAAIFARYLETFWRECIRTNEATDPRIDFVVTPKGGSPILGYEFAKNLQKPFAMHNYAKKYEAQPDEFRAYFDCNLPLREHGLGLIVDDSSTGGTKVLDLINDLNRWGYNVKDCLIVFEPELKEARRKILEKGVRLHSIIKV